jgi:hypothetical protein
MAIDAGIDRFTGRRQAAENHRQGGPERFVPVHRQRDAVGDYHRQGDLERLFCLFGKCHGASGMFRIGPALVGLIVLSGFSSKSH